MRSAVRSPDAAAAAELSRRNDDSWHILGIATATEHNAFIDAASATEHSQLSGNIGSDGPGDRVVSIGSVKLRHDAANEPVTRVIELSDFLPPMFVKHKFFIILTTHNCMIFRNRSSGWHESTTFRGSWVLLAAPGGA